MPRSIFIELLSMIPVLIATVLMASEEIALDKVPQAVIQAANAELPGFKISEASMETEDNMTVYELEGEVSGKKYEIELSADGQILEIEEED